MKQASVYVYEHRGIKTRLMAIQPGIIRVTHTRRDAYLENPSPSVSGTMQSAHWKSCHNRAAIPACLLRSACWYT